MPRAHGAVAVAVGVVVVHGVLAAPDEQGVEDGEQRLAGLGQVVLEAIGTGLVLPALDHAGLDEHLEPGGDPVPRGAGAGHDLGEPVGAQGQLPDHEQGPALADDLERGRDRTGSSGEVGEAGRRGRGHRAAPVAFGGGGAAMFAGVSSKVKLTDPESSPRREHPLVLVALGTALVLVTYVTPVATVPQTTADLGCRLGCPCLDPELDERRARRRPARLRCARGRPRPSPGLRLGPHPDGPGLAGLRGGADQRRPRRRAGGRGARWSGDPRLRARDPGPHLLRAGAHGRTPPGSGAPAWAWASRPGAVLAAGLDIGTGWRETYVVVGVVALALVVPTAAWRAGVRRRAPAPDRRSGSAHAGVLR